MSVNDSETRRNRVINGLTIPEPVYHSLPCTKETFRLCHTSKANLSQCKHLGVMDRCASTFSHLRKEVVCTVMFAKAEPHDIYDIGSFFAPASHLEHFIDFHFKRGMLRLDDPNARIVVNPNRTGLELRENAFNELELRENECYDGADLWYNFLQEMRSTHSIKFDNEKHRLGCTLLVHCVTVF